VQRIRSFTDAQVGGGDVCDHGGLAAAREGVLQDLRELRVPEGHVALGLDQSVNAPREREQGAVDASPFLAALTPALSRYVALAAGEVHQGKLTAPHIPVGALRLDEDLENRMRAAGRLIAARLLRLPPLVSLMQ
jgi:hypothetical protein